MKLTNLQRCIFGTAVSAIRSGTQPDPLMAEILEAAIAEVDHVEVFEDRKPRKPATESNSHPADEPEEPKREPPARPKLEVVARLADDLQKVAAHPKPKAAKEPAPIPLITRETKPWNYGFTTAEAIHTIRDAAAGASAGFSAHQNRISEKIAIQIRQTFAHKIGILRNLQGAEREEGFELLKKHFEARARL